jgi:amicyanin
VRSVTLARLVTPAIALAAAIGLVLLAGTTASPARAGAAHVIEIVDFAFSPPSLTISVGDTVTWTNADPVVHTATSTSGAFDSGDLAQGESYSLTFTAPGTYDYLCTPHPAMTGTIVVEAAAPTAAPTAAPPATGGALPDVAMPRSGLSGLQLGGIALLILSALAALLTLRGRRSR